MTLTSFSRSYQHFECQILTRKACLHPREPSHAFVHDFEIRDMDALFSDGHSLLSMSLKLQTVKQNDCSKKLNDPRLYTHWINEKVDVFGSNSDPAKIDPVTETLRQMKISDIPINKFSIDDTIEKMSSICADSALKSFRQKQTFSSRSNVVNN